MLLSIGAKSFGPPGPPGPQGPAGGPQGPQGSPGIGLPGPQGPQGATGAGLQGPQGSPGVGTPGPQGPQGATGAGLQGPQGAPGVGTQGAQGAQGPAGTGAQGPQGAPGVGTQGPQGFQGPAGTGAQGPQGAPGVGTQGPQGFQGPAGTGAQGPQGAQGAQGASPGAEQVVNTTWTIGNGTAWTNVNSNFAAKLYLPAGSSQPVMYIGKIHLQCTLATTQIFIDLPISASIAPWIPNTDDIPVIIGVDSNPLFETAKVTIGVTAGGNLRLFLVRMTTAQFAVGDTVISGGSIPPSTARYAYIIPF